jgi:hypothetical protein
MTNKTKLLPCPCCEGKAKEMYTYLTSVEWVACLKCGLETKGFGNAEAAAKAWNTRAAPAEDVLAVVEEPVVFDEEFQRAKFIQHFKLDGRIYFDSTTKQWLPTRDSIEGFQMAERVVGLWIGWRTCAEKWNACLDAVEELNK